ncbi:MAG: ArsR family transcriptional regulator [Thermoplasmata archaeon]|nr:ArsR family transcriptional regulator [Thermoplasmata archaeon]
MCSQLKDEERELVSALIKAKIPKNVAKCLVHLTVRGESSSRDIESRMDMRQPEVSIGIQELRKLNWVVKFEKRKEGKGRPLHTYRMVVPFERVLEYIEKKEKERIQEINDNLEKIRKLARNLK